jgi:Zn-dependent M16 (insulinase) family peptidase
VLLDWAVGHKVHGFRVVSRSEVSDLSMRVFELRHERSGAHFFHLSRADSKNAFSVGFRTPPKNSKGVAALLNSVLFGGGSERYPWKNPRRSIILGSVPKGAPSLCRTAPCS